MENWFTLWFLVGGWEDLEFWVGVGKECLVLYSFVGGR